MSPIDFCPAAAAAAEIARREAFLDLVRRGLQQAAATLPPMPTSLLAQMEQHADDACLALEDSRTRLAGVDAVSAAGAMAQLLAAIRDLRVADEAERLRARELETRAMGFLVRAGLMPAADARRLRGADDRSSSAPQAAASGEI